MPKSVRSVPAPAGIRHCGREFSVRTIALIPARYGSTRFPGKLLADLGGRPVLAHVVQRARDAGLDRVVVAVDDERLAVIVRAAGGLAVQPAGDFHSGTDRIAAALEELEHHPGEAPYAEDDVVVNVQGDEPFLEPDLIRAVAEALPPGGSADMATVATPAGAAEESDPNAVKVVLDGQGYALYFSRSRIPARGPVLRHLGLYAYRRGFLRRFVAWPPGALERAESLEQLRALEQGARIRVLVRSTASIGIDTPADLERARGRLG